MTTNHVTLLNLAADSRQKFASYMQAADALELLTDTTSDEEYLAQKTRCEKLHGEWRDASDKVQAVVTPDFSTGDYQNDA
jgi:hypothetical protein